MTGPALDTIPGRDSRPLPEPPPAAPSVGLPPPVSARQATRGQRLALLAGLLVAAWLALQLFASVLLPFVAAAGIAYFLDPPATRLARAGIPRGAAALLLIIALIAAGLLFALLLYPLVLSQIGILIVAAARATWARCGSSTPRTSPACRSGWGRSSSMRSCATWSAARPARWSRSWSPPSPSLIGGGFALFNVLTLMVVTPIVAFYLLRDWPRIIASADGWLPRRYAAVIRAQAREVDRILSAWLRGQAMCCIALALFYAVGLSAVGLDLGLIVGMSAGLLSFIPYVGTIAGGVTSIGLAFAQFPTYTGVAMVAAVFVIGNLLEGYVIYPRFLGDRVELHAVWVIFALFAGGAAFGFVGVLLAVPVTAIIGVLSRFWLRRYLASPLYLDPPRYGGEP